MGEEKQTGMDEKKTFSTPVPVRCNKQECALVFIEKKSCFKAKKEEKKRRKMEKTEREKEGNSETEMCVREREGDRNLNEIVSE